jgi:hypothetical protein
VVGLPGGIDSPLYKVLQEENVNGMKLLKGLGNRWAPLHTHRGWVSCTRVPHVHPMATPPSHPVRSLHSSLPAQGLLS